jgi:MFS transporter, DHA2 family, multidrug resistance protein
MLLLPSFSIGLNSFDASQMALRQLWAISWREAQTLTYADAFLMIMVCFVDTVLLVPLVHKVQPPKQPSADAH